MFKKNLKVTAFASTVIMSLGIYGTVNAHAATVNGNLNVRHGDSIKYEVMGILEKGEEVEILSKSGDWYKIKNIDNIVGWSHSNYINATDEELENANTKNSAKVKYGVNFRKGPSIDDEIIEVFKTGKDLKILSQKGNWYEVETKDGNKGWCFGDYLDVSEKFQSFEDNTNGTYKYNANVRKGPSTSYDIITTLKTDEKVKVLSSENGWYKLECPDGQIGWTYGDHIDTKVPLKQKEVSSVSNKKSTSSSVKSTSTKKSTSSNTSLSSNSSSKIQTNKSGKKIVVSATAYAGDTMTSTGVRPQSGRTIAVDPTVIPYGSRVYIPEFGKTFIAEDCGGGIKGNRIDIFMNSESECYNWGVRSITVQVLD